MLMMPANKSTVMEKQTSKNKGCEFKSHQSLIFYLYIFVFLSIILFFIRILKEFPIQTSYLSGKLTESCNKNNKMRIKYLSEINNE